VSLYGELVLAEDIEIFPIADLPPETRNTIPSDLGEFALSRARSRDTSRVVDRDVRDLLLEFKESSRIVDAVIRYATKRGVDPETTLEGAFEMLRRFYQASVLVPIDDKKSDDESPLRPGTVLFGFTLGHRVHELENTEVFFAQGETGRSAAVKVVREGIGPVEQEAREMRRAGARTPEVYGVHDHGGRGVLIAEWVFGEEVTRRAAAFRGRDGARNEAGLLALLCEVADAFADLHRAGVLHGDIHPGNVLLEKAGRARVIDLGLAVETDSGPPSASRGGVAFYMEPELASARLRGESCPSTEAGEQYALAALLYLLWTGVHYLDWSIERSAMLTQIAKDPPVPFAGRHVRAWPELERVLGRALFKMPGDRFASCADFAAALRSLLPEAQRRDEAREASPPARDRGRDLVAAFYERCGLGGASFRDRPQNAPLASVNYGASGVAYAMYRLSVLRNDPRLLATADLWAHKASILSRDEHAFFSSEIEITEKTVGKASLFHSPSGVFAVRALIALASGEPASATQAISQFVSASRTECEFVDVALGKAGLLLGCAELLESTRGAWGCDAAPILERGNELEAELRRVIDEPIATSVAMIYLGFAHGWAGILFALLRWAQASGRQADPYRGKLDELSGLQEPHGAGVRWSVHNRTAPRPSTMDGWCNGAAGHALLWALAYDLYMASDYGLLAERSATSAWSSDIEVGTLCCGLAGIGYACAAAHRVTGDASWLKRARLAACRACEDRSKWFYADSLYKGAVGAVLLHEELEASRIAMPLVER
jgi:eukaryotic-like serine/threonine-protein kinase